MEENRCPICGGAGWTMEWREEQRRMYEFATPCTCVEPSIARRRMDNTGAFSEEFGRKTFENFRADKPILKDALKKCKRYCADFQKNRGTKRNSLLLCGAVGSGKTHLASAAFLRLAADEGITASYFPYRETIADLKRAANTSDYKPKIAKFKKAELLADAVNDRVITWNSAAGVKPLKKTETPARETIHRALSVEETKAFFECAKDSWYYDLYRFLLNSGLRIGEAAALKVSSFKGGFIEVRRTATMNKHGKIIIGEDAKTGAGRRDIPFTDELKRIVARQRKINRAVFGGGNVVDMEGRIFRTQRGGIVYSTRVDPDIKRICGKAGIEEFTAHGFRDTFATRAVESGMSPKTLQEILGHTDFNTSMSIYAHAMENTKIEEMSRLNIAL